MHHARRAVRTLWFVLACLLAGASSALAYEQSVVADFDGDGKHDRAELDRGEPTALRIRLSTTQSIFIVRSATPILGLAARDLDGDAHAELIASGESSGLRVWTGRRNGLVPLHAKPVRPNGLSVPSRHHAGDDRSDDTAVVTPSTPQNVAWLPSGRPDMVPLTASLALVGRATEQESRARFAPLAARPPPLPR